MKDIRFFNSTPSQDSKIDQALVFIEETWIFLFLYPLNHSAILSLEDFLMVKNLLNKEPEQRAKVSGKKPLKDKRTIHWLWGSVFCIFIAIINIFNPALAQAKVQPDAREVTAAVPKDFPPYYVVDESGIPRGFAVDVMDRVAALEGLSVTYLINDSWTEVAESVKSGRADLIPNIGITASRNAWLDYSASIETFPVSIFVRKQTHDIKGVEDLSGRKVAAVKFNVGVSLLQERESIKLKILHNAADALFELLAGHVDALVYPEPVLMKMALESGVDHRLKIVGKPLIEIKRAIAVRKGNIGLLKKLNQAVNHFVGTTDYQEIYVKWFGKPQPFWTASRVFWTMGGIIISIIIAMVIWRYNSISKVNRQLTDNIARLKQTEERIKHLNLVLRAIRKVNKLIVKERDRDRLLDSACNDLVKTRGYHKAWIVVMDDSHKPVKITESGWGKDFIPLSEQMKRGELPDCAQKALKKSDVVVINEPVSACTDCPMFKSCVRNIVTMTVRLEYAGKVYGLLSVSTPTDLTTNEEEQGLFEEMAGDIAFALYSIKLEEERKRAEEALRESEERYRSVVETSHEMIQSVSPDGYFNFVNKAWHDILGYTEKELSELSLFDIIHLESLDHCQKMFKKVLAGERVTNVDAKFVTKDGGIIFVEGDVIGRYIDDKIVGTLGFFRDITDRKRLEDQLRQTQKIEAIGTLAGGIAHDFNNILGAIIGYTELANLQVREDNKAKESLKEVLNAGRRAGDLVKQILAFSRKGELERIPIQVGPIVKEALKLLRSSLPTTVEIRQNIESDTGIVEADPTQIHQILMNLCTNAAHAMREEGGILEVAIRNVEIGSWDSESGYLDMTPGPYLLLSVSDTGQGMTPMVLERIFEPYYTTKEKGEGTGLGLSVVHGIVKNYGGTITAYSELGKGSTFHVYLPVIQEKAEAPEIDEIAPIPTGNERILFIDDEPALVEIGKQMLERLGYKVTTRTSSLEALELFKAKPDQFDLVITDMTMPYMTGDKLSREFMQIRPDTPIIICSGYSERISEERAKEMGMRAFVMKPLVMRDLANTIRNVLI
jgi:PAS domain S-box-containing protein